MAAVFFRSASAPVGFAHYSPRRGAFFCGLQPFAPKCCEILSQPANALADRVCTRRFVFHALAYMPPCRRLTLGDVSERRRVGHGLGNLLSAPTYPHFQTLQIFPPERVQFDFLVAPCPFHV